MSPCESGSSAHAARWLIHLTATHNRKAPDVVHLAQLEIQRGKIHAAILDPSSLGT
jgi:hypothetical protein